MVPPNPWLDMANGDKQNDCWDDKLGCRWGVPFYSEHVLFNFLEPIKSKGRDHQSIETQALGKKGRGVTIL